MRKALRIKTKRRNDLPRNYVRYRGGYSPRTFVRDEDIPLDLFASFPLEGQPGYEKPSRTF